MLANLMIVLTWFIVGAYIMKGSWNGFNPVGKVIIIFLTIVQTGLLVFEDAAFIPFTIFISTIQLMIWRVMRNQKGIAKVEKDCSDFGEKMRQINPHFDIENWKPIIFAISFVMMVTIDIIAYVMVKIF